MTIQQSAPIYDLTTVSRAEQPPHLAAYDDSMSYPQRIAALLANAPPPPALHRRPEAAMAPLAEETRAMLISVHTLNATSGTAGH